MDSFCSNFPTLDQSERLENHGIIGGDNAWYTEEDKQKLARQKDDMVADDNIKPKRVKRMDQIPHFCASTFERFPPDSA
jgi:hypothetical protein